jgi:hypothetical protein
MFHDNEVSSFRNYFKGVKKKSTSYFGVIQILLTESQKKYLSIIFVIKKKIMTYFVLENKNIIKFTLYF